MSRRRPQKARYLSKYRAEEEKDHQCMVCLEQKAEYLFVTNCKHFICCYCFVKQQIARFSIELNLYCGFDKRMATWSNLLCGICRGPIKNVTPLCGDEFLSKSEGDRWVIFNSEQTATCIQCEEKIYKGHQALQHLFSCSGHKWACPFCSHSMILDLRNVSWSWDTLDAKEALQDLFFSLLEEHQNECEAKVRCRICECSVSLKDRTNHIKEHRETLQSILDGLARVTEPSMMYSLINYAMADGRNYTNVKQAACTLLEGSSSSFDEYQYFDSELSSSSSSASSSTDT